MKKKLGEIDPGMIKAELGEVNYLPEAYDGSFWKKEAEKAMGLCKTVQSQNIEIINSAIQMAEHNARLIDEREALQMRLIAAEKEVERARSKAAIYKIGLEIAGPVAIQQFKNHPFILNEGQSQALGVVEAAMSHLGENEA